MSVSLEHRLGANPKAFLHPKIQKKLVDKIIDFNGVKFQLALEVQRHMGNSDGSKEFTDPVLLHKQEEVLKANESSRCTEQGLPIYLRIP